MQFERKNPSWTFQPVKIELNWDSVVEKESECGKNFISKTIYDDEFFDDTCNKTSPGGYVAPSKIAIAYYMDPRNAFTEKYVFQFLDQSYDGNLKIITQKLLKQFLPVQHLMNIIQVQEIV